MCFLYVFVRDVVKYLCATKNMYAKYIIIYTTTKLKDFKLVLDTVHKAIEIVSYYNIL